MPSSNSEARKRSEKKVDRSAMRNHDAALLYDFANWMDDVFFIESSPASGSDLERQVEDFLDWKYSD